MHVGKYTDQTDRALRLISTNTGNRGKLLCWLRPKDSAVQDYFSGARSDFQTVSFNVHALRAVVGLQPGGRRGTCRGDNQSHSHSHLWKITNYPARVRLHWANSTADEYNMLFQQLCSVISGHSYWPIAFLCLKTLCRAYFPTCRQLILSHFKFTQRQKAGKRESVKSSGEKQIKETEQEINGGFTLLPGWSRTEPHNYWGCNRSLQWSGSAPATSRLLCNHQTTTHSFSEEHHTHRAQIKHSS